MKLRCRVGYSNFREDSLKSFDEDTLRGDYSTLFSSERNHERNLPFFDEFILQRIPLILSGCGIALICSD